MPLEADLDVDLESPVTPIVSDYQCEVCATPLTYGGRGRKPRFCAEHKPKGSAASKSKATNVDTLIGQITDIYVALGSALTFVPPTAADGMIVATHASQMAESWRPLLIRDAKVRKFWERICTGGGWGTVVMAHGVVALAIMQAHNVTLPGFGGNQNV
jgi:hypothetical protein